MLILTRPLETPDELIFKHLNTTITKCQEYKDYLYTTFSSKHESVCIINLHHLLFFLDKECEKAVKLLDNPKTRENFDDDILIRIEILKKFNANIEKFHPKTNLQVKEDKSLLKKIKSYFNGAEVKRPDGVLDSFKEEMITCLDELIKKYEDYVLEQKCFSVSKEFADEMNNIVACATVNQNNIGY